MLNVNANFPGWVHNQFIFNGSGIETELRRLYESRIGQYYLLGDSGDAMEPWLMAPVRNAQHGTPEERYNKRHCPQRHQADQLLPPRDLYAPEKASALVYDCYT